MNNETWFIQKQGMTVQQLGGELILTDTPKKTTHVLNPTARRVWELCDGNHTVHDMERVIKAGFSIPDGQNVAHDIQQAIKTFVEKGLVAGEETKSR